MSMEEAIREMNEEVQFILSDEQEKVKEDYEVNDGSIKIL